jgi:hypothetical protein
VRFGRYCVRYRLSVIFYRIQRVCVETAAMRRDKGERGEVRRMSARGPSAARKAPSTLRSSRLTTCRVAEDGADVRLEFIDQSGKTVVVELPLDQAEAVVMTLPRLLSRAVRQRTGNDEARYVFHLGEWVVEGAKEHSCLIATLKTDNGFEVSFAMPLEACRSFGWTLQHEASDAIEARKIAEQAPAASRTKFN